jgi:hypothetical protein
LKGIQQENVMSELRLRLNGEVLRKWQLDGFPDETVLVVPLGDELFELGVRVMESPSHTAPAEPARPPSLAEVAECIAYIAGRCIAEKGGRA